MRIGLFCFRRDLRLHDNLALCTLANTCNAILPVFCLDPRQVHASKNSYYSAHSVKFMLESLVDLNEQIEHAQTASTHTAKKKKKCATGHLNVVLGKPEECLPQLVAYLIHKRTTTRVTVAWNEDNTPFSIYRDEQITNALQKAFQTNVDVMTNADDVTIVPVRNVRTNTGTKYQMFTPFYRKTLSSGVAKPKVHPKIMFLTVPKTACKCTILHTSELYKRAPFQKLKSISSCVQGGRTEALKRLTPDYLVKRCTHYDKERDHTWEEKTTRLSAYFKFGCVSFREAYYKVCEALQTSHPIACKALIQEFFWNTFYSYISYHFPHVLHGQLHPHQSKQTKKKRTRKQSTKLHRNLEMKPHLQGKLDSVWNINPKLLQRWKDGQTGFPYVDAAMRQLYTTGWMHNRARMVVASFLVKDLRIDWREGEKHFARHLVDYDPSANNGGWQWAASTGADALQYTRIFNPWTQSKKFDPRAIYIKTYVKELSDPQLPANDIHNWFVSSVRKKYEYHSKISAYPAPMIDHRQARKDTLAVWKSL